VIACIVLAAGASTRLGRPKQLLSLGGRPLLAWVLAAARGATFNQMVLVLGHDAELIRGALDLSGFDVVVNERYAEGMSLSLRVGLETVRSAMAATVVMVGDQPFIESAHLVALKETWENTGESMIATDFGAYRGPPMMLARSVWPLIDEIRGDQGARALLRVRPGSVLAVEVRDSRAALDVDTEEAYATARELVGG
jgi:molybdenum cofactor cytidylyltransferase